jgi:hypothetical protein
MTDPLPASNGHTEHPEVVRPDKKKKRRTGLFIAPAYARRVIRRTKFKAAVPAYEREESTSPETGKRVLGKFILDAEGKRVPKVNDKGERVYENVKQLPTRGRMRKYAPLALASFTEASLRTAANEAYACVAEDDKYTLKPVHFFKATTINPLMGQLFPGHYLLLETKRAAKKTVADQPEVAKKAKLTMDGPVQKITAVGSVKKTTVAKKSVSFEKDDFELAEGKMELVED